MSMASDKPAIGTIGWRDITVEDAEGLRDFYQAVVGWRPEPVPMGDYSDFSMVSPETGEAVAGVCHAVGPNAELPPQWLLYVVVEDLDRSLAEVEARGGERIGQVRSMSGACYCAIRDPAGAALALFQHLD